MPKAIFKSVYAVSSEDPNYPAANLLKSELENNKPWKTKGKGEKSAFVILQMNQSYKITDIDIGNEHSAFIEILVGKNACSQDDFKEILISSSFMTPPESKNSTNINRVRMFSKEALVQNVLNEKWDLIKIVCTQPFNPHVQYGLGFIKIHVILEQTKNDKKTLVSQQFSSLHVINNKSPSLSSTSASDSGLEITNENPKMKFFGSFKLREDSPDSESESSASLFNRWKQNKQQTENGPKTSTAAIIRDVSSSSSQLQKYHENLKPKKLLQKDKSTEKKQTIKNDVPVLDRNRNDLYFGKEDNEIQSKREILLEQKRIEENEKLKKDKEKSLKKDNEKKDKSLKKDKKDDSISKKQKDKDVKESKNKSPQKQENSVKHKTDNNNSFQVKKRPSSPTGEQSSKVKRVKNEKPREYRPFNKLLQGVNLVISGIQNPDRAELRQKAIEMGAKYKPDWDSTCTHLICAFKNTPKYNQVKGHGKIITRYWIEKCYTLKRRLPWRRYAIDDIEQDKSESEDEIYDLTLKPNNDDDGNTEKEMNKSKKSEKNLVISDESDDTEDELERVRLMKNSKKLTDNLNGSPKQSPNKKTSPTKINGNNSANSVSVYDLSTEEEDDNRKKLSNKKLFFNNLKFFIGNVGAVDKIKIKQYIEDHGGEIIDKLTESNYIITNESIIEGTTSKFNGEMITPLWIYECNDMECLIPTKRYRL